MWYQQPWFNLHGLRGSSSSNHTHESTTRSPLVSTLSTPTSHRGEGRDSRCGVSSREHKEPLTTDSDANLHWSANPGWVNSPLAQTLHIWFVLNYKPHQVLGKPMLLNAFKSVDFYDVAVKVLSTFRLFSEFWQPAVVCPRHVSTAASSQSPIQTLTKNLVARATEFQIISECAFLPKTLTKLQKAACSRWSERLSPGQGVWGSRYKEDTAGKMPPSPLHSTDDAVHCLQDPGTAAGPPVNAAMSSRWSSSPYITAPWANQMDAALGPKGNWVEILALLQDAFSALLS